MGHALVPTLVSSVRGLGFQYDPQGFLLEYGFANVVFKFASKLTLRLFVNGHNKEWGEEGEYLEKGAPQMV